MRGTDKDDDKRLELIEELLEALPGYIDENYPKGDGERGSATFHVMRFLLGMKAVLTGNLDGRVDGRDDDLTINASSALSGAAYNPMIASPTLSKKLAEALTTGSLLKIGEDILFEKGDSSAS